MKYRFVIPLCFLALFFLSGIALSMLFNRSNTQISSTQSAAVKAAVTQKYLMTFHACKKSSSKNCSDPKNHKIYLAQSDDGQSWKRIKGWKAFKGSVPDVIRRDDTLYLYSANNELVRYHVKTNMQDKAVPVEVEGLDAGFVDPSLFVDEDGRLVLFFLYGELGGDPAQCAAGKTSCVKNFGSATEVEGSDGTQFTLDDGYRAQVTLSTSGKIKTASDPDIFYDGEQYILYISYGPSVSVWTSDSLRGEFTQSSEMLSNSLGGIPAGFYNETNKEYWTFTHTTSSGYSVIRRAVHDSVSQALSENDYATVISGSSSKLGSTYSVESPGFAVNVP